MVGRYTTPLPPTPAMPLAPTALAPPVAISNELRGRSPASLFSVEEEELFSTSASIDHTSIIDHAPSVDDRTPSVDDRTSSVDDSTSSVDDHTYSVDDRTPSVDDHTPSIDLTASVDNDTFRDLLKAIERFDR